MANIENLIPGQGRPKGVPNRTTAQRTELFKQKLDKENLLFRAIDIAALKLDEAEKDPTRVKLDSIVNLITKFAPYYIQNVAAEVIAEQVAAITNPEDAQRVAQALAGQLKLVR